jgi:hypothetical protein
MAPTLLSVHSTHRRRKETVVLQKKSFKVLAAIPKRDGGTYWMRCGSAFTNKDDSINIYLDAIPKDMKFQLRELDEEDLRRRETSRSLLATGATSAPASGDADAPPF